MKSIRKTGIVLITWLVTLSTAETIAGAKRPAPPKKNTKIDCNTFSPRHLRGLSLANENTPSLPSTQIRIDGGFVLYNDDPTQNNTEYGISTLTVCGLTIAALTRNEVITDAVTYPRASGPLGGTGCEYRGKGDPRVFATTVESDKELRRAELAWRVNFKKGTIRKISAKTVTCQVETE